MAKTTKAAVKGVIKGLAFGASVFGHVANFIDFWNVYSYATANNEPANSTSTNSTSPEEASENYTTSYLSPAFWFCALAMYDVAAVLTYCCVTRKEKKEEAKEADSKDIEKGEETIRVSKHSVTNAEEMLEVTEKNTGREDVVKRRKTTFTEEEVITSSNNQTLENRLTHLERLVARQQQTLQEMAI